MSENKHFVVWKRILDFEGFPMHADIIAIKHSRPEAEDVIAAQPITSVWSRGGHREVEYIIKEI